MGSSFSRAQAANGLKNANTATLRSALTNYINATKNLKNKQSILSAINNKPAGSIRTYRNMIGNGVANAVVAARGANLAVNAAKVGAISESAAAVQVNNAAKQINKLQQKVEASSGAASVPQPKGLGGALFGVTKGNNQNNTPKNTNRNSVLAILKNNAKYQNNKSKINAIIAYNPRLNFSKLARNNNNAKIKNLLAQANSIKKFKQGPAQHTGYNLGNNNQTGIMYKQANNYTPTPNNTVNTGKKTIGVKQKNGKYMLVFKNSTGKWTRANTVNYNTRNAALNAGGAGGAASPAAANNRFKNMNINTLVKSAAQTLTNENKVKLKAAIKAKMNTLNEKSMNRVRLVNANRNLN